MKFTEKLYCNHDVYCMGGKKIQTQQQKKNDNLHITSFYSHGHFG